MNNQDYTLYLKTNLAVKPKFKRRRFLKIKHTLRSTLVVGPKLVFMWYLCVFVDYYMIQCNAKGKAWSIFAYHLSLGAKILSNLV